MRFLASFCLVIGAVLALLAADPQQPKVGNTQVINATNGYGGILTVRTQVNVGYAGEPGILTLQSTNGTYTLTIQYDTDGALLIQPESLDAFDVPALRVKPGTALTMGNIQDWEDGNGVLRMSLEIEGTLFTRRLFAINDGIPNGDQWTRIQYGDITIHPDLGTNTIYISGIDHTIVLQQSGKTNLLVAPDSGGLITGPNTIPYWGAPGSEIVLLNFHDATAGDADSSTIFQGVGNPSGPQQTFQVNLFDTNRNNVPEMALFDGKDGLARSQLWFGTRYSIQVTNNLSVVDINPEAIDGSTPFSLSTHTAHSSGKLFTVSNVGTNFVGIPVDQASTNAPLILNINGTQKRVHVGAIDSGGTGLRALTIEN